MAPWFDGLTGPVDDSGNSWRSVGLYTVRRPSLAVAHIVLFDLPFGTWTHVYQKKVLVPLLVGSKGGFIERIDSDSTDSRIHYTLVCDAAALDARLGPSWDLVTDLKFVADPRGHLNSADASVLAQAQDVYASTAPRFPLLEALLKLTSTLYKTWMYRLDTGGHVVHYPTVSSLIRAYAPQRLRMYEERFESRVHALRRDIVQDENRTRFVREITGRTMSGLDYETEEEWWADLATRGYVSERDPRMLRRAVRTVSDLPVQLAGGCEDGQAAARFKYLTGTEVSGCTRAAIARLEANLDKQRAELKLAEALDARTTWLQELSEFEGEYRKFASRRAAAKHVDGVSKTQKKAVVVRKRRAVT